MTRDIAQKQKLLGHFAGILSYPDADLREQLRVAETEVTEVHPEAGALLANFGTAIKEMTPERVEEIYTIIFDLNAVCHPYIGYQIFGETYRRSVFLVGLKEHYRTHSFVAPDNELADRLSLMLEFVSECSDQERVVDIIQFGFAPSLAKMTREKEPTIQEPEQKEKENNPYAHVLKALQIVLDVELPSPELFPVLNNAGGFVDVR
jgi:nitrate reductase delta subunit